MSSGDGGCEICGRGLCTRSFHSLREQEEHDNRRDCEERGECYDCQIKDDEIISLEQEKEKAEEQNRHLSEEARVYRKGYEELEAERDELKSEVERLKEHVKTIEDAHDYWDVSIKLLDEGMAIDSIMEAMIVAMKYCRCGDGDPKDYVWENEYGLFIDMTKAQKEAVK